MPSPILEEIPESFETERLLVRAPKAGDGPALNEAVLESFAILQRWLPWAQVRPTVAESEAHARESHSLFLSRADLRVLYFLKSNGQLVGGSGLHRMDWNARRFEIGYWCRTSLQGQGYVTELVRGFTELAFTTLRANRVEIRCSHRNVSSARVAERAGYPLEATLKDDSVEPNGQLRDTLIFALTRSSTASRGKTVDAL
jgi:ribosomal-protein-serine acetyltransferase